MKQSIGNRAANQAARAIDRVLECQNGKTLPLNLSVNLIGVLTSILENDMPSGFSGDFQQPFDRSKVELKEGVDHIVNERERQIREEGWTKEHDRESHPNGELAMMACCYAAPWQIFGLLPTPTGLHFIDPWPLLFGDGDARRKLGPENPSVPTGREIPDPQALTRKQRIDLLAKAGALIAAEIDRLQGEGEQ